ncbi:aminotransferase class I/II-fold pyridoxal phosphate-dependent enzyme [Archangium primigenium]|uniref:aminotransferase class I/II-fold pyridoxal phosphate-dependent enzyme n=1 Tax=[Archangium] primigenium TaxID=2792470 RepID=UPI00195E4A5A|nr:aminotransferase class I/II-fold pyridoxal phosphate-dependent enzyme [Archangium primigenium]MBM7119247.1 aminotransferase class I/II-fold pyridoxal phosphate-dependent enzyme [Archangium primigenium]
MVRPARHIENVRYAIRNVVAEAHRLETQGRRILYLNIGDPLKFDFQTPPHLIEAVSRAMRDGHNGYAPSAGILTAREAIARECTDKGIAVSPDDVVVTSGASEALELALTALLEPGERVLLPCPGYPLYGALMAKLNTVGVPYTLDEEHDWSLDLEEIDRLCTPDTRAILLCNPNNPTGAVLGREVLQGLLEIARRRNLVVLSDEIYDKLIYDKAHVPTAALATDVPILTFNGLTKAYLTCGWRVGWLVFNNAHLMPELRAAVLRLADARLCSSGPQQHAIAPALDGPQEHIQEMMTRLRARRDLTVRRINAIPGLSMQEPSSAFYAMPRMQLPGVTSDEAFVMSLLRETGVLFVHGSGFGQKEGTQHFRIVFLPQEEVLTAAFDRLEAYVREHHPV